MKKMFIIFALFCLPMVAVAQFGHWEKIETMNKPPYRSGQGMAPIGKGKILMYGGGGAGYLGDTWIFDWEKKTGIESNAKIRLHRYMGLYCAKYRIIRYYYMEVNTNPVIIGQMSYGSLIWIA